MSQYYPSKRVKNHAAKKLRDIFKLKGKVILKHAPNIFYTGDECFGLCYSDGMPNKAIHRIIISEIANPDTLTYFTTLLHEYVHAWQFENGFPTGHNRKSMFPQWAAYLKETQKGIVI